MRFIVWGTIPIGTLSGGALATWIGFRETIVVAAIGGGLGAFLSLLLPRLNGTSATYRSLGSTTRSGRAPHSALTFRAYA